MKKWLSMVIILTCALSAVADEYGYFLSDSEGTVSHVTLGAGDRMIILSSVQKQDGNSSYYHVDFYIEFPSGDTIYLPGERLFGSSNATYYDMNYGNEEDRTFVGPCTVYPRVPSASFKVYAAYRITRASDNSIKPANVIVLPADVDGDMQLVFESSDDLLTWDQVYSFTHNSSNQTSRFFRTRLIQGR